MMEQYRSIKKTLAADTVLFFRLGDFYEMFFEDAARASEILNITLTGREGGAAGRIPMCGIPHHAFGSYVRTLLDRNLKVAVCEQIGDPQAAKGLVERRITRIITPATYLDDETKPPQPEYLVSVSVDPALCALPALDPGTGEFFIRETTRDRLPNELALLRPRELILPRKLSEDLLLKAFLKESADRATVTVYDDWIFDSKEGSRFLKEGFSLASERAVAFHDRPLAVGAAGAVLYYLKEHLHLALGHIRVPVLLASGAFMGLDRQAVRSLELVAPFDGQNKAGTLLGVIDQTVTPMGGRALYQWVTHPLLDLETINQRHEAVEQLVRQTGLLNEIRLLCKGVRDVERTLSRLNYGVANARDLLNLKLFFERLPRLIETIVPAQTVLLKQLREAMRLFPDLREAIDRAVTELPPLTVREGGMIRSGYSAELDELHGLDSQGKEWLAEFERRESERTGIKSLRVRYNQVFGYSIEISKSNLGRVPPEYRRKQTLANAERFVVPELQQWDEKITGAQEKIKELEYQLFLGLRAKVLEQIDALQQTARAVGSLDALASLAFVAAQGRWVRPQMTGGLDLEISAGRHPVVERMLPAGQFVENDARLNGAEHLILLTGPNMAGKSTYIRQTALIVLLAQIGSFVPARSAVIGLVDRIFTRIGAHDDLARGESTFMVEMIEMAQILRSATRRSLLILDEVGRGTSTFDGVSLAWAICESLAQGEVRPRTLFATHYHELIQLEGKLPGMRNYSVAVKETPDGIIFLRTVVPGGSDRSYGIHVAQLAGIPAAITRRASEILQVLETENSVATQAIEGKPAAATHPIIEQISKVPLDQITPLEALTLIAEWKEQLKNNNV